MTETYVGKVVRKPVVRPKVIFTSVELANGETLQVVVFPNRVPFSVKTEFSNAEVGQEMSFVGTREINTYNREEQIVVTAVPEGDSNVSNDRPVPQTTQDNQTSVTIPREVEQFIDQHGRKWFTLPDKF